MLKCQGKMSLKYFNFLERSRKRTMPPPQYSHPATSDLALSVGIWFSASLRTAADAGSEHPLRWHRSWTCSCHKNTYHHKVSCGWTWGLTWRLGFYLEIPPKYLLPYPDALLIVPWNSTTQINGVFPKHRNESLAFNSGVRCLWFFFFPTKWSK